MTARILTRAEVSALLDPGGSWTFEDHRDLNDAEVRDHRGDLVCIANGREASDGRLLAAAPDLRRTALDTIDRADALLEVLRLIAPRCRKEDCEAYATRGQRHFDSETFRCDEHGGALPELKHVAVLRLLNGGAT